MKFSGKNTISTLSADESGAGQAATVGVLEATGAAEVHASCRRMIEGEPSFSDFDPPNLAFSMAISVVE